MYTVCQFTPLLGLRGKIRETRVRYVFPTYSIHLFIVYTAVCNEAQACVNRYNFTQDCFTVYVYPLCQTHAYYTSNEKPSAVLPSFPNVNIMELPASISKEKLQTFMVMYRTHCQRILDSVVRATFNEVSLAEGYRKFACMSAKYVSSAVSSGNCPYPHVQYTVLEQVIYSTTITSNSLQDYLHSILPTQVKPYVHRLIP